MDFEREKQARDLEITRLQARVKRAGRIALAIDGNRNRVLNVIKNAKLRAGEGRSRSENFDRIAEGLRLKDRDKVRSRLKRDMLARRDLSEREIVNSALDLREKRAELARLEAEFETLKGADRRKVRDKIRALRYKLQKAPIKGAVKADTIEDPGKVRSRNNMATWQVTRKRILAFERACQEFGINPPVYTGGIKPPLNPDSPIGEIRIQSQAKTEGENAFDLDAFTLRIKRISKTFR